MAKKITFEESLDAFQAGIEARLKKSMPPFGRPFPADKIRNRKAKAVGQQGPRVSSLDQLADLARHARAVVIPGTTYSKPCPAAWVMSMQAWTVNKYLIRGIYVWIPAEKKSKTED